VLVLFEKWIMADEAQFWSKEHGVAAAVVLMW
jgi:hypothetical protein